MRRLSIIGHRSAVLLGTAIATSLVGDDSFPAGGTVGDVIQRLRDPFAGMEAGTTTYATVGPVPAQLALTGSTIVRGSAEALPGTAYAIGIVATSGDGRRSTMATITLMALGRAADGPVAPIVTPTPTPTPSPTPVPTPTPTPTPAASLGTLTLSGALTSGTASSGSISGATAGSTIATTITGLTLNSSARTYTFDGSAAAGSGTITETLADASNSPRTTSVTIAAATVTPKLTLSNVLTSITPSTAAGTKIADIAGVPSGVTPTISPADGRVVIAGSQSAGWTIVRGMTAVSAGTLSIAVAAAGATGVSLNLSVVAEALQAPVPNPVTVRTIGPAVTGDTGWQDMGGVAHAFHAEAANSADTGAFSIGAELYVGCDKPDDTRTCGLRYTNFGNGRYQQCYYWNGSAWTAFQFNRGNVDFSRDLTLADKLDMAFEKDNTVFVVRLNGAVKEVTAGAGTVASNFIAQAFPNGPGKYARYVRTGGSTPSAWAITLSGGSVQPITLRSAELDADTRAVFRFSYTGTPIGYLTRRTDTAGNPTTDYAPAVLVLNSQTGEATYRSAQTGAGPGTSSIFELIEAQDATTPKAGATPIKATLNSPSPAMFGINLNLEGDFYHNQISNQKIGSWRNHFGGGNNYNLRSWTEANPQLGMNGSPTQAAMQQIAADNATTNVITGVNASPDSTPDAQKRRGDGSGNCGSLCIVAGRKVGQRNRVIWDGPQSMGTLGDLYGIAKNPTTGTNGTQSWIDFDHQFDPTIFTNRDPGRPGHDSNTVRVGFKLVNGVGPENVKAYEIVSQANPVPRFSGDFDTDYLTDCAVYRGHALYPFRTMDVQNIILQYDRVWSASDVSTTMGPQFGQFAWSYPRCLAFFEAVGAGGQICYPLQADESFVRKVAAMCAVWSARTKLHIAHELSNEPWNSGQPSYFKLIKLGQDAGDTNTDLAGVSRKQHAKMSTQIMKWITDEYSKVAGASQYMHRIVNIQNATTGNTPSYASNDPDFLAYHDEYQVAPYLAGKMGNAYPTTYADITDAHLDDFINKVETVEIPKVFGWAATNRDYAKSVGKRIASYEGFFENMENAAFQRKLKNDSVRWPYLVKLYSDQYATRVGGLERGYVDNGFTYGYRAHVSQSPDAVVDGAPQAIGWKARRDYIASKPTI